VNTSAGNAGAASPAELHPTEHRGLRELFVRARDMGRHHSGLAERLAPSAASEVLENGATAARRLGADLAVLAPSYGIDLAPAAQGLGTVLALVRNGVGDRLLERGQALRAAAGDLEALALLVGYLARVAERRGDERLVRFCGDWYDEASRLSAAAREVAIEQGDHPDDSIRPVDESLAARAGQRANYIFGAVGEWVDRRLPLRSGG
jgi:hypothetical protein